MWIKRNTPPLLVVLQTGTSTLKISLEVPWKIGNRSTQQYHSWEYNQKIPHHATGLIYTNSMSIKISIYKKVLYYANFKNDSYRFSSRAYGTLISMLTLLDLQYQAWIIPYKAGLKSNHTVVVYCYNIYTTIVPIMYILPGQSLLEFAEFTAEEDFS